MSDATDRSGTNSVRVGQSSPLPAATLVGLLTAVIAVLLIGFASYRADQSRVAIAERVNHTYQVLNQLALLVSALTDSETAQRGYLLTNEEKYLAPHTQALAVVELDLRRLRTLTSDNARQQQRLDLLEPAVAEKIETLTQTIALRRSNSLDAALIVIRTDRGKLAMDRIRVIAAEMGAEEHKLLEERQRAAEQAADLSNLITKGGSALLLFLIAGSALLLSRDHKARERESWLKSGQTRIVAKLQGDDSLDTLGERILDFLSTYLGSLASSIYVSEDDGRLLRIAHIGATDEGKIRQRDGLIGRAIKDSRALHVRDVPAGYLTVASSLGKSEARELAILPLKTDGAVVGVIELGFFRSLRPSDIELLDRLAEPIAFALASSRFKARLRELLEESQRQGEELEAQQAELEATNEEMSQTNALMEVQTEELERQRDDLVRAREVADKASRYKSEFLANMSHELRTPLNSSLILARLLADNREGNLNPDQIRSAETIYGAGNDLLVLINDILDLAKIEAGRADIVSETVPLSRVSENLERFFRPVASEKRLTFQITRAEGSPDRIVTDGRRLEQVLKNLLSNAFKFTSKGEVAVTITAVGADRISFSVRDTGIGIAAHQKEVIFEAFRQADGTTSRKYGGTGLGLSISRELARLLGGELNVESVDGKGSTFTLILPVDGRSVERPIMASSSIDETPRRMLSAKPPSPPPSTDQVARPRGLFADDRDALTRPGRLILGVEDDPSFARILYDLAHELDFDCVIASTADEGLVLARDLHPSGILLDIGLPDASGLSVLERLKREPATRHLPIHIVSSSDNMQTALELGAIGYALKPVAREELVSAIHKLQERHAREVRHVLVVEDDVRQQESIKKLLGGQGVELMTVGSVKDALAQLEQVSFDCMVLDLTLPDGSGYDLLEKMAEGIRYSFPPVIVYTGRDLERADEEKLRRYSRSIIVKGARSPERLLDEVTLFLHQVEASLPAPQRRMLADSRQRETVFEGSRILIVEDDVRNVFALTKVLEPRGAKVEIARNGREALEALEKIRGIDLVLMDLMMPEMDGLTAIREIRKKPGWKRLPIIALTAKAMADDREQAMTAGANDYMAKPFDVDKLVSLCRVWLPR